MKRLFLQASAWILCILLATACKNAPQNMNGGSYKTMEVTRGTRTLNQNYTAVINGRQSVEIRPQVSGTITQICIDEGAKVKKGQTLVIIDQVPYEAALQTAVANVKNAEAQLQRPGSRQKAKKNYSKNMLFLILICKRHETVSFRLKQLWHKPKPTKLMPETICHIQRLKVLSMVYPACCLTESELLSMLRSLLR